MRWFAGGTRNRWHTAGGLLGRVCGGVLVFLVSAAAAANLNDRDGAAQMLRLFEADTDAVIDALPVGFDPNQELFPGFTLLAIAAVADDAAQIKRLVAAGFDPKSDTSALDKAAEFGALNAFTVLLDAAQPPQDALDRLAYQVVNSYYVHAAGRELLVLAAKEMLGVAPARCSLALINELIDKRIDSETDGHLKILALLKARGAALNAVPGGTETFATLALERGDIYLYRTILGLNGQLASFAADTAINNALQNGNAGSLVYMVALTPDRFTPMARAKLLETNFDKLNAATFEVLSTPDIALPQDFATRLLARFVQDSQPEPVRRLIQAGADVHRDAPMLLRLAALAGQVENVRLLLAAGARANAKSGDGLFVLAGLPDAVIGAHKGRFLDACGADRTRDNLLAASRLLIEGGAPLVADDNGTLLFDGFLAQDYLDPDFIAALTPTDSSKADAAVASAAFGNLDFVRWFVEVRGVPVTVKDATGRSLVQAALSSANSREVAPFVFARLDSADGLLDVAAAIEALEFFYELKCDACVQKLLASNLDLNRIPDSGLLFINTALHAGDLALASRLMELGASPLLPDKYANRAVDFLCRREPQGVADVPVFRRSVAQLFLANNVDLRSVTYDNRSILFDCFTATTFDETILETLLLLNGGVIEPALVEYALERRGRIELEWLKRNQINFAGAAPDGTPFLHVTIRSNNIAAFNMLLEQPTVDFSVKDASGHSALEFAFEMQRAPMARSLVAAGAALPQDAKGLSGGFVTDNNELSDVVLMDLLSEQVLAEVPYEDEQLIKLIERMEAANQAAITFGNWTFDANKPWPSLAPYTPPAGVLVESEGEIPNTQIGMQLLTTLAPHRYAAIAQSKSTSPQVLCMPPNICYEKTCGYCSYYEFTVVTRFTLPSCAPAAAQECLSTAEISNHETSEATLMVMQAGQQSLTVKPGSSVHVERSQGPIDVAVSAHGSTFYARFAALLDGLPEWPNTPAVSSSERLRLYKRALGLQNLIAGAPSQSFYSSESAITAHRYWSAKMARARYAEVSAEKLRKDLEAVETVPAIFDRLFDSLADVEQLGEVQLPVFVQQVRNLAQVMDAAQRDRLNALAKELESAAGKAVLATARLLEVRDALLAHHRVLADSLRLNLLEYFQYGDRVKDSPLKHMVKVRKEAVLARLRRKPGEIVSQSWSARDAALIQRFEKAR